jgi:hypothetical protein
MAPRSGSPRWMIVAKSPWLSARRMMAVASTFAGNVPVKARDTL